MSIYREKRGLNWGAALQSLGQDLGNYAEQQRQERLAAEERKRQELALKALYQRQDELATQQSGMVLPESFRLPGAMGQTNPMSMGVVGGMRVKPATEVLRDMYPVAKQSTRAAVPPPEEFVVVGVDGQPQVYSVPFGRVPSAVAALETPDYSPLPAGVDDSGRKVYRLDRNWERPVVPRSGGGASGPKPMDLTRSADALTEAALGPAVEKTTAAGNVYDFSMGGTQAGGPDLQNLAIPELRRGFWQAARDSSATGRWPIDAPSDVLAGKIFETVAPQYAEVAIPAGWEFRPGDPNTTADDKFVGVDMGIGKFDKKKNPLEFFKEYVVPQVNEAKDAKLGWQALVNSAAKYGLNPDDLKPLLDQQRFQQFFSAAQTAKIDDEINEVFR